MKSDLTAEVLQALLVASDEQKKAALKLLKGIPASDSLPSTPEPFLGLQDTARILNVHHTTLWKWRIPGHRWAGRPKYRLSEVLAYLESDAFLERAQELGSIRRQQRRQAPPDKKEG